MDREQAEKLIPILQGFLEGGELQERATGKNEWGKHSGSLFVSDGGESRSRSKAREGGGGAAVDSRAEQFAAEVACSK